MTDRERWYAIFRNLKRVKVGDLKYQIVRRDNGQAVGDVVKTGSHLDDYPWDWSYRRAGGAGGSADTLTSAVQEIASCEMEAQS